jgi:hypothetical protein
MDITFYYNGNKVRTVKGTSMEMIEKDNWKIDQ